LYSGVPRRLAYASEGWGVGEVWLEGERLLWHELPRPGVAVVDGPSHPLTERFTRFFAGARDDFLDVELDVEDATPFQRSVTEALRLIPYGETVTYAELAALAGYPRAQRAVGTFCARNRYGVVVPCHRVTAADGLGSYGSLGVDYKRRLLALEGAAL
jgi:methylated-DNA-[protein]-cysteine S-methyltransferase